MNKICTSTEQSKKLLELGIDVNTADMTHITFAEREGVKTISISKEVYNTLVTPFSEVRKTIPAWSLSALLELMPIKDYNICWDLTFGSFDNDDNYISKYNCSYIEADNVSTPMWFNEDCPLDAVFEMVCWLKENGKI